LRLNHQQLDPLIQFGYRGIFMGFLLGRRHILIQQAGRDVGPDAFGFQNDDDFLDPVANPHRTPIAFQGCDQIQNLRLYFDCGMGGDILFFQKSQTTGRWVNPAIQIDDVASELAFAVYKASEFPAGVIAYRSLQPDHGNAMGILCLAVLCFVVLQLGQPVDAPVPNVAPIPQGCTIPD